LSSKHDILTEEELAGYQINTVIYKTIKRFIEKIAPPMPNEEINILDWGCGRGRSVAKLKEEGFNAYGVDIDETIMHNGYRLFEQRGLNPDSILLNVKKTSRLDDGFFHIIFSEQVLEHIKDIYFVLAEMYRLTKPGGIGIHCFPGSKKIFEEHLKMPLVHWLPKNNLRKIAITFFLAMGYGPKQGWPATNGKNFWFKVEKYHEYLNNKTFYRNIDNICKIASYIGFIPEYKVSGRYFYIKLLPPILSRNGFPKASLRLFLFKKQL
jgi:ubiquinone/menaquinone biosynthesis C-methylase UbiE